MKFSYFDSVRASSGYECTYDIFLDAAHSNKVKRVCAAIAQETDKDKIAQLKKQLPIITWQSFFPGKRLNKEARPSGLFMFDVDHVDNPFEIWSNIASRREELGILFAGMTASRHGLRIIAKCRKEYTTIAQCQKWLAEQMNVEYDDVCKDFARSSFVVDEDYTYFMDAKTLFQGEPEEGTVYKVEDGEQSPLVPFVENQEFKEVIDGMIDEMHAKKKKEDEQTIDQRGGLFGYPTEYKGMPLKDIAVEWLMQTGGMPAVGERNIRLYKCALRMRYICDFNEYALVKLLPDVGLPEAEVKELVKSALAKPKAQDMPTDLQIVLNNIDKREKLAEGEDLESNIELTTDTSKLPPMPPVIKQFVDVAPDDFKQAVLLCQLPILGALASKLRSKYLDGEMHSPSFQVSLEAPQASGKSFMRKLTEYELKSMIQHDDEERAREAEYDSKIKEMKMLNIKITPENKNEILGQKPTTIIRFVPATMSITKLLMRMQSAEGLHLFAIAEEIDTVTKAFKKGFSSYSDLLRVAFDNGRYGQDYASENSFSGNVNIYYNMLTSGTPKAMRRFYPDVEDGLVSRVLFVTLPDQFGKKMPVWKEFTKEQKAIVDRKLVDCDEVSLIDGKVQPDHVLKMEWLNEELKKWLILQQQQAVQEDDRTRDIFCRRSAVIGFRAGMLAFFLYGGKVTPTIMKNVKKFALYVANCTINQHLLRFNVTSVNSNVNQWEKVYARLDNEFDRDQLRKAMSAEGVETPERVVIYKWRLLGIIESLEKKMSSKGKEMSTKFKKVKK